MTDNLSTQSKDSELLELMRKREIREAKEAERQENEREEARKVHAAKVERRRTGDAYVWTQLALTQSRCDHRKGTSGKGPKTKIVDYMVSRHVFSNGVAQVKCLKCKHKAFPGDTKALCHGSMDAFIANTKAKKGPQLPNPTKLSYSDFYSMTLEENTSNRETRAEMVTQGPAPVTA